MKSLYRFLSSKFQTIHLDYPVKPSPRGGGGLLKNQINKNREAYRHRLETLLKFTPEILSIRRGGEEPDRNMPVFNNGFLPGLDIIVLYGMLGISTPSIYLEIGSGNSTKVARKAIMDQDLQTKITSIDPFPRSEIDHLSDQVIRQPVENLENVSWIADALDENDILFIDNSHRVFPNSDAMVCFLEILPNLKPGVIVQFHDIYLPYDYPQFMCDRFYNEQYMLAAFLMSNPDRYQVILPNFFISEDKELSSILAPMFDDPALEGVERHGGSFWIRIGKELKNQS